MVVDWSGWWYMISGKRSVHENYKTGGLLTRERKVLQPSPGKTANDIKKGTDIPTYTMMANKGSGGTAPLIFALEVWCCQLHASASVP